MARGEGRGDRRQTAAGFRAAEGGRGDGEIRRGRLGRPPRRVRGDRLQAAPSTDFDRTVTRETPPLTRLRVVPAQSREPTLETDATPHLLSLLSGPSGSGIRASHPPVRM